MDYADSSRLCIVKLCGLPRYCRGYCNGHYHRLRRFGSAGDSPIRPLRTGCLVEGCERRHYSKGYCQGHYERTTAGRDLGSIEIRPYARTACSVEGCDDPHYARDYCCKHYNRWRSNGTTDASKPLICSVPDCGRKAHSRGMYQGLCRRHAERVRIHGSVDIPGSSLLERIRAKIDLQGPVPEHRPHLGPCHLWTSALNEDEYPRISHNGRARPAHRLLYALVTGNEVPKGMTIDHVCMVPWCMNLAHFEIVTRRENSLRMWAARRDGSSARAKERARERMTTG